MIVLASYNLKGGVGKTATALTMAHIAAKSGVRTLLWDLDAQGAASYNLRGKPRLGQMEQLQQGKKSASYYASNTEYDALDLIAADSSIGNLDLLFAQRRTTYNFLSTHIKPLRSRYEMLVLDCPPGLSLIADNVFAASDIVLMPTIPSTLSIRSWKQVRKYLAKRRFRPHLMPFFTMVDSRRASHRKVTEFFLDVHAEEFLQASVPYSSVVENMGSLRRPLTDYAWSSVAAKAYRNLFNEVIAKHAAD